MLVLHPNNSTLTFAVGTRAVFVALPIGVSVAKTNGVLVIAAKGVLLGTAVMVAIMGVALLTPITTGVGESIDGVRVGGRKGVGGV